MALKCGIVGLPNVGKSTLFNCLSSAKAQAANFPFCTIEPNVGVITVPDGTTLMIDAGDNAKKGDTQHPDATKLPSEWQAIYMKHFMSQLPDKDNLDYAMITHFHNDHMGTVKDMIPGNNGYGLSGITLVGERIHFNKLVDRGWPNYDFPSKEKVLGANKGFMPEYIRFAQYSANHGTQMEKFEVGSKNQFTLVHNPKPYAKNFEIRNLASYHRCDRVLPEMYLQAI